MRFYLCLFLIVISVSVKAQDAYPGLVTDRPDQTESSAVVPLKAFQIETGFMMETDHTDVFENRSFAWNTTLVRYGLLHNLELRLGMEYLGSHTDHLISGSGSASGLGPLYTGLKINVLEEAGAVPEVAFLAGLTLPFLASEAFQPQYTAPDMRIAVSHTLSEMLSLAYNLGAEWDGDSAVPGYFYSAALGIGVTGNLGMFVETYGLLYGDGDAEHMLDAGFTYLVLPDLQVDLSAGIGINEHAIDNFISFGLSYRIR